MFSSGHNGNAEKMYNYAKGELRSHEPGLYLKIGGIHFM